MQHHHHVLHVLSEGYTASETGHKSDEFREFEAIHFVDVEINYTKIILLPYWAMAGEIQCI